MNAIVIVDSNWGIGKNGDLLVHLPGDLKYYKEKTTGNVTVVGRKTLESFPGGKPLPNRTNIVITRDADYEAEGCVICRSKEEALEKIKEYDPEKVFIAGGAEIYKQFMDDCDGFYVTKIYESFDADRFFPNLDEMGYKVVWESPLQEEKGLTYRFLKYERP
ncbi:MAG: dihydrofolate reductase [Bacillota bacterium]|nr:dihydrofolate reductase [Bacillota bacterium]